MRTVLFNDIRSVLTNHTNLFLFQDDIEIDLDEVLDMEDEQDRRHYISVSTI